MNKRAAWAILLLIALFGVIVLVNQLGFSKPNYAIDISNLSDCTKNINHDSEASIANVTYSYLKAAQIYNKQSIAEKYDATVRNGSCKTLSKEEYETSVGKNTVTESSFILDIPAAKQSWVILISWVPNNQKPGSDLGPARLKCPEDNQLKYGDFHCINAVSKIEYGTYNYDPILKYMPYNGVSFDLSYDPDTKTIAAAVLVPPEEADNAILINNIEQSIPVWLKNKGLDPTTYTIKYRVVPRDT